MPLPTPILDDRSYAQLRDELIQRIRVYTEEWTDHNASDPGITLIELFSFLSENLLYRFNQIPEAAKLEFLRLLQIPLRPPQPARAMVGLSVDDSAGVLVTQGTVLKAGAGEFETETEVRVLPVTLHVVSKKEVERPVTGEEAVFFNSAASAIGAGEANVRAYDVEPLAVPGEGEPVDFGLAVDRMIWIAVLAEGKNVPGDLRKLWAAEPPHLNIGFVPDQTVAAVEAPPCPGEGFEPPVPPIEWRISTGRFEGDDETRPIYRTLRAKGDTRALTREGVVRLELPAAENEMGAFVLSDRDLHGTGDLPPPLDEETEERLLFWISAFRPNGESFGRVLHIEANASAAVQSVRASAEFLGTGNGQPHQTMKLVHRSPLPGTLQLEVEGPEGWRRWDEVEDFTASTESARHYVLDREAGQVRFGNGLSGYVPQIGERIRAVTYRYGGGASGNVAAGAIKKVVGHSKVKAVNALPAAGGADAESVAEGLERIPGELRRRDRAVTVGDFRELALQTPGAEVGRAECLPRYHLFTGGVNPDAPGVVTVMVWPKRDAAHPDSPRPDRGLLNRVCCWLDGKRLVTTELYVVPPVYRRIAVAVGLAVKPRYGAEAVRSWVDLVLRQYLAPLPPFGPSGLGWPLGRRVHGPELEAAALQVEGVEFLENLEVAYQNAAGDWITGSVELEKHEVPELTEITVVEGANPTPPGSIVAPPPPLAPIVPVPTITEEC